MQNRAQTGVKLIFLVAFFFIAGGMWFYELYYVKPAKECEAAGNWWYRPGHQCATPVKITDLTGRHMDDPDLTTEQGRAQAAYNAKAATAQAAPKTAPSPAPAATPATK